MDLSLDPGLWRQVNIAFRDWAGAENVALAHLAPILEAAETEGLITSWFFIRKAPCWRVRYLPSHDAPQAMSHIRRRLAGLKRERRIDDVKELIYEPETHAFGGVEGMAAAHRLFHLDTRNLLAYLANGQRMPEAGHRRELSIVLCSALLRAAGLDWYEQGDVWARVADHREPPGQIPGDKIDAFKADLRRLMSVDATLTRNSSPRAFAAEWAAIFAAAGWELADLAADGLLRRGLRAILAHHVIFAWNRHGLPYTTQAILAHTAKAVVFGNDPTAGHHDETT